MKNFKIICLITVLITVVSCNKGNRFKIDTNQNKFEVKIHQFDKDMLMLDTTKMEEGVKSLYARYPEFMPAYVSEVLDTTTADTAVVSRLFHKYLTDTAFTTVNKKALELFSNVSDIEKQITDAFTYIHYYFPEVKLPEVYFYVSGYNRPVMMNNKLIGIGTDFYLGSDFPKYNGLTYKYLIDNMKRECLATDLVSATLFRMFRQNSTENRLLDNMLFRGKVLYLMSVFMPEEKPERIIGYSPEQLKWCKTNEKQIWATIIEQKHLFSTDLMLIRKYLNDGPFTAPISQESPGRLGTWVGLQIVESYMQKNKNVTLRDLMNENSYQKMLENSEYKP